MQRAWGGSALSASWPSKACIGMRRWEVLTDSAERNLTGRNQHPTSLEVLLSVRQMCNAHKLGPTHLQALQGCVAANKRQHFLVP